MEVASPAPVTVEPAQPETEEKPPRPESPQAEMETGHEGLDLTAEQTTNGDRAGSGVNSVATKDAGAVPPAPASPGLPVPLLSPQGVAVPAPPQETNHASPAVPTPLHTDHSIETITKDISPKTSLATDVLRNQEAQPLLDPCGNESDKMFERFRSWALSNYGDSGKTKTVTRKKYQRIVRILAGEELPTADNSKFRFWVKNKGFRLGPPPPDEMGADDQVLYVPTRLHVSVFAFE